ERAHGLWKKVLAEFELPKVDVAVRAAIDDFVERRKAEGGAHPES
ncbi:MAG: trimethylamine methyltransferase family protein, partial [Pseudomonadota bacterium]